MSDTVNDGGPAFPNPAAFMQNGLSLRDYFAAMALTRTQNDDAENTVADQRALARWAYAMADAMLVERAKGQRS
jgi:hypothetical protein